MPIGLSGGFSFAHLQSERGKRLFMKNLSKKRKTEIANEIIKEQALFDSTPHRHLRNTVRAMLVEAIDKALAEVGDDASDE
jgi:hypothetical protein